MKFVQEFLSDNLSGFSLQDVPNFFFAIFLAAFWAYVLGRLYLRSSEKSDDDKSFARQLIVLAMGTAVIISIIRYSVPLAIAFAALLALVRFTTLAKGLKQGTHLYLTIAMGLAAGAGFGIVASLGYVIIVVALLLAGKKQAI
jgi:4-amino-4-deoxy-L-arabinose transferase-like glycosyltransferase